MANVNIQMLVHVMHYTMIYMYMDILQYYGINKYIFIDVCVVFGTGIFIYNFFFMFYVD